LTPEEPSLDNPVVSEPETTEITISPPAPTNDSDTDLTPIAYQQRATRLVLGPNWTYEELDAMPSWRESVDRVALALVNERRAGFLQARPTGD
jgi:hypothetical protein